MKKINMNLIGAISFSIWAILSGIVFVIQNKSLLGPSLAAIGAVMLWTAVILEKKSKN